jgi:hypothetical protein
MANDFIFQRIERRLKSDEAGIRYEAVTDGAVSDGPVFIPTKFLSIPGRNIF